MPNCLLKQMIMVRESGDAAPDVIEYRHGLTPPMRDARKRRFRREPDLNVFYSFAFNFACLSTCVCLCALLVTIFFHFIFQPELVSRVEKDLLKIIAGGTADNLDILTSCVFQTAI